jgi:hypothetical protein
MRHGITGVAATLEHRRFVGIECDPESYKRAVARFAELFPKQVTTPMIVTDHSDSASTMQLDTTVVAKPKTNRKVLTPTTGKPTATVLREAKADGLTLFKSSKGTGFTGVYPSGDRFAVKFSMPGLYPARTFPVPPPSTLCPTFHPRFSLSPRVLVRSGEGLTYLGSFGTPAEGALAYARARGLELWRQLTTTTTMTTHRPRR